MVDIMRWYAIFVQTGKEDEVCIRIKEMLEYSGYEKNFELLVPKRKIKERRKGVFTEVKTSLFPGYVLISSDDILEIFHRTKKCNFLYRFLRIGETFEEIRLEEISNIIYMADEDGVIGISDIFVENDMIKVLSGPLCNYTGVIKKIDKHKRRAKVVFKFSGQDHLIDVSINIIKKIKECDVKNTIYFRKDE